MSDNKDWPERLYFYDENRQTIEDYQLGIGGDDAAQYIRADLAQLDVEKLARAMAVAFEKNTSAYRTGEYWDCHQEFLIRNAKVIIAELQRSGE